MKLNPKDIQKAMQRFGIQQKEIPAIRVLIELQDKQLIFENPKVAKVNMMGDDVFQISGDFREEEKDTKPEIKEEDIKTVMEQTNVDKETVIKAIEKSKGDLAQAIISLQDQ